VATLSVVTVAGICNSVGGGAFFDMPPQCRGGAGGEYGSVLLLGLLLMSNKWMS